MKQRLGIAMALVGDPDLLLLDEPINGLDPQGIVEVRDTILKLNRERNITIIISSHILEELSKIATKYGIIRDGELVEELSADALQEKCRTYMEIRTEDPQTTAVVLDEMGLGYRTVDASVVQVFEGMDRTADINAALVQRGVRVNEIFVKNESLENYFLNVVGGKQNG